MSSASENCQPFTKKIRYTTIVVICGEKVEVFNENKDFSEWETLEKCLFAEVCQMTPLPLQIPVACKTCPLCKSHVGSTKNKPEKDEEGPPLQRRRTERVRRERPDFFNSLEVDNQFKKKRRKDSTRERVKPPPDFKPDGLHVPTRGRGRPRSVTRQDSDSKGSKTPSEEDFNMRLPPEKLLQYTVILAEINRKFMGQNFNPDS